MNGLEWTTLQLPLAAGLNQRADDRARPAPSLDIARDCQFDELGGIQTRLPFAPLEPDGALEDARRIVAYGNELVVFTKDAIWTRFNDQETYIRQATHLAVKVTEETKYVSTGDQYSADTARLSGLVIHTWVEGSNIYVAASDETTGAVILPPNAIAGSRPKLVVLSTRILLFWRDAAGKLVAGAIDPAADPADIPSDLSSPATVLAAANFDLNYDATRILTTDTAIVVCRRAVATSYTIATVTSGLVVTASTKARTCDGGIAVASHPAGTHVQVARTVGAGPIDIVGDYIQVSGLTDVTVNQAIGSSPTLNLAVTAAYRSVQNSGQFRCYIFWTSVEGVSLTNTPELNHANYVDTGGTIGTAITFAGRCGIASRAFEYDGSTFVIVAYAEVSVGIGRVQNSYFLYRDDGHLAAKMAAYQAGAADALGGGPQEADHLAGVQLTGTATYTWCGLERRAMPTGSLSFAYTDRGPRDITLEFDSNEARRTALLGSTLYISGGEIKQYDHQNLVEVGFHTFPVQYDSNELASGVLTTGDYSYKVTWRWDNAVGERERSTTATTEIATIAASPGSFEFTEVHPLTVTHKTGSVPAAEFWRTAVDAASEAPFFLVTSRDPADSSNPNRYVSAISATSVLPTFEDNLADTQIAVLETFPENGGVLDSIAPPAATIIVASDSRLFLGGVAGDPNRVWYSRLRGDGEIASFNEALTIEVPLAGGPITSLAFLNETLIVFRESAIYAFPGDGFDNLGQGQNYGPSRILSVDCGAVNHESVALTDQGLIFKSAKGWYLLNRGWSANYIGAPVSDYDSEVPLAVHVLPGRQQIRCLSAERMLVLDTVANQWSEWTIDDGLHAEIWQGDYCYLTETDVEVEQSSYSGLTYGLDVETAWIKPADLQGAVRIRKLLLLGEYRSAHNIRVRVSYNYDSTVIDDFVWTTSPTTVGGPLQLKFGPSRPQCQAIKVRFTAVSTSDSSTPPTGEALKLTGLGLELGMKRGLYRRLPAAQQE